MLLPSILMIPSVTIAPGGLSASLSEDPSLFFSQLINDPGAGNPQVILAGPGTLLSIDFNFNEASGEEDEFLTFIVDAATGFSIDPTFEFLRQDSASGTFFFDLSTLVGNTLGLAFQLSSNDSAQQLFDSTVEVSNVRLVQAAAVNEPETVLLMALGLPVLAWRKGRAKY